MKIFAGAMKKDKPVRLNEHDLKGRSILLPAPLLVRSLRAYMHTRIVRSHAYNKKNERKKKEEEEGNCPGQTVRVADQLLFFLYSKYKILVNVSGAGFFIIYEKV